MSRPTSYQATFQVKSYQFYWNIRQLYLFLCEPKLNWRAPLLQNRSWICGFKYLPGVAFIYNIFSPMHDQSVFGLTNTYSTFIVLTPRMTIYNVNSQENCPNFWPVVQYWQNMLEINDTKPNTMNPSGRRIQDRPLVSNASIAILPIVGRVWGLRRELLSQQNGGKQSHLQSNNAKLRPVWNNNRTQQDRVVSRQMPRLGYVPHIPDGWSDF